jgi:hypothetical protein
VATDNARVKRTSTPQGLGAFLPTALLNQLGARLDEASRLAALWRRYAPAPLAEHVRAVRYEGGTLQLEARSPAWATRVRHSQHELLTRLRAETCFRGLREVRVRVRPTGDDDVPTAPPAVAPTRLSTLSARLIDSAADDIDDPQLRAALKRLGDATRPPHPRKRVR